MLSLSGRIGGISRCSSPAVAQLRQESCHAGRSAGGGGSGGGRLVEMELVSSHGQVDSRRRDARCDV